MSNVGYATLTIIPSAKGFGTALAADTAAPLASSGKSGGAALGSGILASAKGALAPIAGVMAGVFATKAIIGWGQEQIASLSRIGEINAQTESAIKATGGAAGVSAQHVEDLAGSLENLTGTEAESTQMGANLLLTFKNIKNGVGEGNDIFDQTTKTLVDMARAMGQDPQSAAIQLGKALNDPVAGISALTRVGVTFSEDQKKVIQSLVDSGDVMGAQKIILAELNSEFGGAGASYAATYAGKVTLLGHAWGTFGEQIFSVAMPALGAIAGGLTGLLNNVLTPGVAAVQGFFGDFVDGFRNGTDAVGSNQSVVAAWGAAVFGFFASIGNAVGPLFSQVGAAIGPALGQVATAFGSLLPSLLPLIGQFATLWTTISPGAIIIQALLPILPQLAAVLATIAGALGGVLATAATTLVPIIQQLATILGGVLASTMTTLAPIIGQVATILSGVLLSVFETLGPIVTNLAATLGPILGSVLTALGPIVTTLATAFGMVLQAVLPMISPLLALLQPILGLISPLLTLVGSLLPPIASLFGSIIQAVLPLVGTLADLLIPIVQALLPVIQTVFDAIGPIIQAAMTIVQGIIEVVTGLISGNWDQVWHGLGTILSGVWDAVVAVVTGAINIVSSVIGAVLGFIGGLWSSGWASIGKVLSDAWNGIVQGVKGGIDSVVGFFSGLWGSITSALSGIGTWLLDTGKNLVDGLVTGIKNAASGVWKALSGIVTDAIDGAKKLLGIHSPSRVFREIGKFTGEGLALGLADSAGMVQDAADALVPTLDVSSPDIEAGGLSGALAAVSGAAGNVDFDYHQYGGQGLTAEQELQRAARRLKQSIRK